MNKVVVTGSLASGKSTVCQFLKELGAYVVNADEIVHRLLTPQNLLGQKLVELLGNDILKENNFDKALIAERLFKKPELLQRWEQMIHPAVYEEVEKEFHQAKKTESTLFVVEVPLFFESSQKKSGFFDKVVTVVASKEKCLEHYLGKGGNSEQFSLRNARQLPIEKKAEGADFILHNESDLIQLKQNVKQLFHLLTEES